VDVSIQRDGSIDERPLAREAGGTFAGQLADVAGGLRYGYRLDGSPPYPDPASRFQPDGVHGASMTVDPQAFHWTDLEWTGVPLAELVIYELHVGTFTRQGTFAGVLERLPDLRRLGITAIELMPLADFAGNRNWGYDGAALFAPARCYGTPDDLRQLVDAAHSHGLAVLIDVVYNHLGPDGSYLPRFSPYYLTSRHSSPWGAGINFDGDHSSHVRAHFIESALHWIHEYHADGLRLDATHAIRDDGPRHFVAELSATVHASNTGHHLHVIAEDDRNLALVVMPEAAGGWGADALWADDFHHQLRRRLAGDADGYFIDYSGSTADVAATIRRNWFYSGQHSAYRDAPRGSDSAAVAPAQCVVGLQTHDQIGNRAFGERLHHQIDGAQYRAASMLLLSLPQTPLLFMGQEWGASTPFLYFTDHEPELGRLVTEGRRREFSRFAMFADERARAGIPDPQAVTTFTASRLDWKEPDREPHAATRRLYAAMLAFRRRILLPASPEDAATAQAVDDETLRLDRRARTGAAIVVITRFRDGSVQLPPPAAHEHCELLLTSDDSAFCDGATAPDVQATGPTLTIRFHGPATLIFQWGPRAEVTVD
jgi:maltooligosyltrehalose trehalohydrolase